MPEGDFISVISELKVPESFIYDGLLILFSLYDGKPSILFRDYNRYALRSPSRCKNMFHIF